MNGIGRITTVALVISVFLLAACGGGGGSRPDSGTPPPPPDRRAPPPPATADPTYHLGTARFTTHQPAVLEQVGAHHAYAKGLTGRGVRIGIEDSIVDYTQSAEFGSRVRLRNADGAELSYLHPFGDEPFSDVWRCRASGTCRIRRGDSQGDEEAHNDWVRQIVREDGWPKRDDSAFFLDEHYPRDGTASEWYRWREIPTPYGREGSHGTNVASVAAGTRLGVAPGATIIPVATNLTDDQSAENDADALLLREIAALPPASRRQLDEEIAAIVRTRYERFDIINRSFGVPNTDLVALLNNARTIDDQIAWYRANLPKTLRAEWQADRSDADKTIVVYAAGNDYRPGNEGARLPTLGALLPFGYAELRGHTLAVAATDPRTRRIAGYSNRCGPLPPDWNAARHGRHYCLVAPGTVRGLAPDPSRPGRGTAGEELTGTSFAAPIVSGALALLKEHFRGTRGNTQIVRRMIDTADRSGIYADAETYGAGHLDLAAALSPVGPLDAGQSAQSLGRTTLRTPAAYGSVARRVANVELAAFDRQSFPFWVPLSGLVSAQSAGRSPIPEFASTDTERVDRPAAGLGALGLHWAALKGAAGRAFPNEREWMLGLGRTSASLARRPHAGGWGYGLGFDGAGYLGSEAAGAFGSDLRSGMIWTSRAFERALGGGWALHAEATLAWSMPRYEDDAIFSASPSLMSAASMRVGTASTGLTVEQPLRAESGTGTFRVENGRMEGGRRLRDEYRIALRPDARAVRFALRHERDAPGGDIAVEIGHSMNAGHVPGASESGIGFAYRMTW